MAQVLPAERDLRRVIGDADGAGDRQVEGLGEQELLELYRSMVQLRTYDERSVVYHSQGRIGSRQLKAYLRAYSAIDPVRYISRAAPASLLFQNGTRDPVSPRKDVDAYFRAASKPKERHFYGASHELDAQALADRDAWLVKLLLG